MLHKIEKCCNENSPLAEYERRIIMPLTINKILYATDLSKNSAYAFRYAVDLAKNHDADIHLLHVVEKLPPAQEAFVEYYFAVKDEGHHEKIVAESIERTKKKIEVFRDREIADHPEVINEKVKIEVLEGYPVDEILKKAKSHDCDIIVMGTHGKGFMSHTLLGSVAERVLRRSHKPVIIVPLPEGETEASLPDF
jgi:nucleotide-binding universal stress UspA family protein